MPELAKLGPAYDYYAYDSPIVIVFAQRQTCAARSENLLYPVPDLQTARLRR